MRDVDGKVDERLTAGDSRVDSVAIVETRYAVRGWGAGEIWRRDGIVLAHDFHFGQTSATVSDTGSDELISRFRGFLHGEDVSFADVAIDLDWTTPLQRALVEALRAVPRGEVVSYGELAALAGRPSAPRAAGALCSANRFAFVVPCHRVVAAHGIGGYGSAGVEVKRRLLALEGVVL
jgi:O-6-methylguanine DNA methyltransferase